MQETDWCDGCGKEVRIEDLFHGLHGHLYCEACYELRWDEGQWDG